MEYLILVPVLFALALVLSIFGKGGGEFYVPILLTVGLEFHKAAATSLFLLMASGATMMAIFGRKRLVDWGLALAIFSTSGLGSFLGGFVSAEISPIYLKLLFAILLLISAYFISKPMNRRFDLNFGPMWFRSYQDGTYGIRLALVLPMVFAVGLAAGLVGISGGGLIVPILILFGGVPIRVAFATNSVLVLLTSATGFLGHALNTPIDWPFTLILASSVISGAVIGAELSTKIRVSKLRKSFVWILVVAAIWMIAKIWI